MTSGEQVEPRRILRQRFIADLWFVLALLTPLFAPALVLSCERFWGARAGALIEIALTGPLGVMRAVRGFEALDFFSLCALPTGLIATHALALRLNSGVINPRARRWRFIAALMALAGARAALAALALGFGLDWHLAPSLWLLWASSWALYVAVVSLWAMHAPARRHGFEMILGLVLLDHVALPTITALRWL